LEYFKRLQALLARQAETSKQLQDRYKKIIDEFTQIAQASLGLSNALFDLAAQNAQKQVDMVTESLDRIDERIQESANRLSELEGDLADKDSGRRDAVLAAIEQEKQRERDLAAERLKLLKAQEQAERKAANIRKAQAITQAVINGALAITNIWATNAANPILAGILTAISASTTGIQIGTIASQKFADGGFTGDGTYTDETGHKVAGVVHDNEWVAPKWLVQSPQYAPIIESLDNVRRRGFASGGYTSPMTNMLPQSASMSRDMFNSMMREVISLSNRPIYTSVKDINSTQQASARRVSITSLGGGR
jgi:hypothetical protein